MGWPYQQKPPMGWPLDYDSGLVPTAGWPMLAGSGSKVFDLSGNNNTGTLQGDTIWTPGKFGPSLSFDGVGDYVGTSLLWQSFTNGSFFGWGYLDGDGLYWEGIVGAVSTTDNTLMVRGTGLSGDAVYLRIANIQFYKNLPYDVKGGWHFYGFTLNGTIGEIYLDGKSLGTGTIGYPATSNQVVFGASRGSAINAPWKGKIDNVLIYNRALSASEIALLYRYPFYMYKDPAEIALLGGYQVTPSVTGIMTTNTGYWGSI